MNKNESTNLRDLKPDEIQAINTAMEHYEENSAVAFEALKIIQKYRGWVSDDSLIAVADLLKISPSQLEGLATFYNLIYRQPVGKSVIHYCNSVTCWMMGGEQIRERLCQLLDVELGEISHDGQYTILPIACLGACDHAPVAMIGNNLQLDLTVDSLNAIILR